MNEPFTLTNPRGNFKQWYSTIPSRELEREAFARNLAYRCPRQVLLDNAGLGLLVALGSHLLLGLPKAYVDAVRHHGSLRGVEWSIIWRAFWDGFLGYTGSRTF